MPVPLTPTPNQVKEHAFKLVVDNVGDSHGGVHLECVPLERLRAVPAPAKMRATIMQQFDGLGPVLQVRVRVRVRVGVRVKVRVWVS